MNLFQLCLVDAKVSFVDQKNPVITMVLLSLEQQLRIAYFVSIKCIALLFTNI